MNHLTTVSFFGGSLRSLRIKKKKKKSKKVHDSAVRDHSFTQIFVHNDGIRKCSFMVPEYFFYFGFLKKLIDLSVQVFFVCLFISVNDNLTEPIKKK